MTHPAPSPATMTRRHASTDSATHRLRQAFKLGAPPDWTAARAAILAGAPVDTPIPVRGGATPLIVATMTGDTTEVGWLLDRGAGPDAVNSKGEPALIRAVLHSHTAIAVLLLEHGADPNARDRDSRTALMVVSLTRDAKSAKDLIATLLDHGADPSRMTSDGRTLPEIFASTYRQDMLAILDRALASPQRTEARQHLLARLTAGQRLAWLPKSSAAEAAMAVRTDWHRTP